MYSIIATIVLGVGAVLYFIRLGKKLEKGAGWKSALRVYAKINREKATIEKKFKKELVKKNKGDPRDFFNDGRGID